MSGVLSGVLSVISIVSFAQSADIGVSNFSNSLIGVSNVSSQNSYGKN